MKKITQSFAALVLMLLVFTAKQSTAQCAANFTYSVNANGNVTFTSTSTLASSISTTYYWTYGNGSATFTATNGAGMFPSTTYTANGSYVVSLFILSTIPSCSAGISQTITVNTVNSGSCNLVANFTASQGANGLVNFNNTSAGTASTTTYAWSFGNGNTSTALSPSTTYTANGTYIATLTANNNFTPSCTSTKTLAIVVNSNCNLNAAFNAVPGSNGNVTLSNLTTPSVGVTYTWNFGNSTSANGANPALTYNANGTYTITLMVQSFSPACTSSASAVVTISNVSTCNLNANFTASQTGNGGVTFNNTSTGTSSTTTYAWTFGNGNSSTANAPSTSYTANGSYVVTLVANNNSTPTCASTKTLVVNISNICNLSANFNYTVGNNGQVSFANVSTGTASNTTYLWNFGDNSTSTSANPPTHTYATGVYNVLLTLTNFSTFPTCQDTAMHAISVTNTCVANANFTLSPTGTPKFWNAIPASTANISAAQWSWGDGTTSNTLFTSHLYSVAATYTICLSTTVNCGATASYCGSYYIFKSNNGEGNEMIEVNVIDASSVGIKNVSKDENMVMVYPNPNCGLFSVKMNGLNDGNLSIEVYNIYGQLLQNVQGSVQSKNMEQAIDLSSLPNGVYMLKVGNNTNTVIKKVSVQK